MLTRACDLPTAEIPTEVEEFIYTTTLFLRGEKVHLFERRSEFRGLVDMNNVEVLTDSGFLILGKELRAAQKIEGFTKRVNEGCRYLGTGVVHRRIT